MDRLILLRHGKAESDSATGDDFDRRLAPRGEFESADMGARLADMGFVPDIALVSPAARAKATWEHAREHFPKAVTRLDPNLYHADSASLLREARKVLEEDGCSTVMVVAHNPGLQELTVSLLRDGNAPPSLISRAQNNFPTATAAVFLIDDNGRPQFDGLFFPNR